MEQLYIFLTCLERHQSAPVLFPLSTSGLLHGGAEWSCIRTVSLFFLEFFVHLPSSSKIQRTHPPCRRASHPEGWAESACMGKPIKRHALTAKNALPTAPWPQIIHPPPLGLTLQCNAYARNLASGSRPLPTSWPHLISSVRHAACTLLLMVSNDSTCIRAKAQDRILPLACRQATAPTFAVLSGLVHFRAGPCICAVIAGHTSYQANQRPYSCPSPPTGTLPPFAEAHICLDSSG